MKLIPGGREEPLKTIKIEVMIEKGDNDEASSVSLQNGGTGGLPESK